MTLSLVYAWHSLHRWRRRWRWPLKAAFLVSVSLATLYPKFWLLPRWLARLGDFDRVVDPYDPALTKLEQRLSVLPSNADLRHVAAAIEKLVIEQIPYAFDWETWGVVDYLPTVAEVFARGREDCDGRAVVAASLLRRLGYQAQLVSDLKHTWVVATDPSASQPQSIELMGPGAGEKTLSGDISGTRTRLSIQTFGNLSRGLAFGIAVFPLARELVLVGALWLTLLHPRCSPRRAALAALLLLAGLLLCRAAGPSATATAQRPVLLWCGLASGLIGCTLLLAASASRRPGVEPG